MSCQTTTGVNGSCAYADIQAIRTYRITTVLNLLGFVFRLFVCFIPMIVGSNISHVAYNVLLTFTSSSTNSNNILITQHVHMTDSNAYLLRPQ